MELLQDWLGKAVGYVWNYPLTYLCLLMGIFLTFYLRLIQLRGFIHGWKVVWGAYEEKGEGVLTHLQALSAALSATVGLGNIAGVAVAVASGGPGAVFWMWMIGFFGMATKYTECGLATVFRQKRGEGEVRGGPMYYMVKGISERWKPVATFFAVCCAIASLGGGNMFQSNQMASALKEYYAVPPVVSGAAVALLVALVVIGGIKRIGQVASLIVPFMCATYVAGALIIAIMHLAELPGLFGLILRDAFTGQAVAGGSLGTVIMWGVRRAVFSSEAGLGSAPMAHSAVRTEYPMRQGVVALLEPFIDTIVVCSATAVVVVLSGLYTSPDMEGVTLKVAAFEQFLPGFGKYLVALSVCLFAYSTAISWSYYGETGAQYAFGPKAVLPFKVLFCLCLFIGAVWKLGPVLDFSDLTFGLMAIPNLIALLFLAPKARELSAEYFASLKKG